MIDKLSQKRSNYLFMEISIIIFFKRAELLFFTFENIYLFIHLGYFISKRFEIIHQSSKNNENMEVINLCCERKQ